MALDPQLEPRLAGLSPEARLRVENALKEALAKEGLAAGAFDRGPFDRSGFDRSSKEQLQDISTNPAVSTNPAGSATPAAGTRGFPAKEQGPSQ